MTEEELRAAIEAWKQAALAVAKGQSYTIDGLQLTRVDASMIQMNLNKAINQLNRFLISEAGGRDMVVTPNFNNANYR